jgi:hypothetical protein
MPQRYIGWDKSIVDKTAAIVDSAQDVCITVTVDGCQFFATPAQPKG